MKIEAYEFGRITINGQTYTQDLKIIGGTVVSNWWRSQGHKLSALDIQDVLRAGPEVLVVGTGYSGLMTVSQDCKAQLADQRIELIAKPTGEAVKTFNSLLPDMKVAFAAHLTC